jgi:hypothetical protein
VLGRVGEADKVGIGRFKGRVGWEAKDVAGKEAGEFPRSGRRRVKEGR